MLGVQEPHGEGSRPFERLEHFDDGRRAFAHRLGYREVDAIDPGMCTPVRRPEEARGVRTRQPDVGEQAAGTGIGRRDSGIERHHRLAGVVIEVREVQNPVRTADPDQSIAPLGLSLHPLAVHVPVGNILDLDMIRSAQIVPERFEFRRDLLFCLVMLNGNGKRSWSVRGVASKVGMKCPPDQPVEADRHAVARPELLGVHGHHEGRAASDKLADQFRHQRARLLDLGGWRHREVTRDAARDVNAASEQPGPRHQRSSTTGDGFMAAAMVRRWSNRSGPSGNASASAAG